MWIALKDGFLSAVQHRTQPDHLVVRARNEDHLTDLFPNHELLRTRGTDYPARVIVSKDEFAQFLANRVEAIDYSNFKNSVADHDLHDFYVDIWEAGRQYQLNLL